ncbi:hypothetical protein BACI349Y_300017 [Bacillus sp. 349Y]|nr:hypothetical protein BACI349Y_300017 [Bacillus sp. 349Y]
MRRPPLTFSDAIKNFIEDNVTPVLREGQHYFGKLLDNLDLSDYMVTLSSLSLSCL